MKITPEMVAGLKEAGERLDEAKGSDIHRQMEAQTEMLCALGKIQAAKADGFVIGRGWITCYNAKSALALAVLLLALAVLMFVVGPYVGSWLREWRGQPQPKPPAVEKVEQPHGGH